MCWVATIGPLAIQQASGDSVGDTASCTWMTSNSPSLIQRQTLAAETTPKFTRATDPL